MRLKYSIEFTEQVTNKMFVEEEVLAKVTDELRKHLDVFLSEGGFSLVGEALINIEKLEDTE